MAKKKFYKSKTIRLNALAILISIFLYFLWSEVFAIFFCVLGLANLILRFFTKSPLGR